MRGLISRTILSGLFLASTHLACVSGSAAKTPEPPLGPISLDVDARDAPRRLLHAKLMIPAKPGPLTLYYPKWIPGEHSPSGPIVNLTGVSIKASGKVIPWRRDSLDMFAFHCDVPAGASSVEVSLDYLLVPASGIFTGGETATSALLDLSWNHVLLSPAGSASAWKARARLTLPPGWKYGTALPVESESGGSVAFKQVSLTTLVDSPLIAGAHFRSIPIDPVAPSGGAAPIHRIDMVADGEAALAMSPRWVSGYQGLVAEALALFGARHYESYRFLLTLSDRFDGFGLEHHASSDNRLAERTLLEDSRRVLSASLLPHEFVHSWNGKYRRPVGLNPPDFQEPLRGDLLWVYEGLTQYLGAMLTARSGLWSDAEYMEALALIAAAADARPGRSWRPLADTAVAAQILYPAPIEGAAWRRQVDFYDEGALVWLDADIVIRRETQGKRSLDDFCRRFHGGAGGGGEDPPKVSPYTFDDIINALAAVAPYDWRGFWAARVTATTPRAPIGGITEGGYRLVFTDAPNDLLRAQEDTNKGMDLSYSIGFALRGDGSISDVIPGTPAAKAGLSAGMKIIAVNGRRYSSTGLRDALRAAEGGAAPIDVLTEDGDAFRSYAVDYHGGERYPHLVRDASRPDLLGETIRPLVPHAGPPPATQAP